MLVHVRIFGRVQGVGFRAWTERQAEKLNLSGWVRNRSDGSVEVMAEGENQEVDFFLTLCQKGPLFAKVMRIEPVRFPDAFIPPVQKGIFTHEATV